MQNYCKTIGALAAASALVAGNASAEVNYEMHGGYTNQYIFRGVDFGDSLTEAGIDMDTKWNGLGLSAGAWYGSYDATVPANPFVNGKFSTTELDLYGEVSKDLGFLTAAVGYIKYINDDTTVGLIPPPFATLAQDSQEVYFSVAKSVYGVDLSLTYFWDIETDNDGYTELAASKSFELSPCLALGLKSAVGYAAEEGRLANWTTTTKLDWAFTETATLSPFVAIAVEGGADEIYGSDNEVELVGGSMLTVKF